MAVKIKNNVSPEKIMNPFLEALWKATLKLHELVLADAPVGATSEIKQKIDFLPKIKGRTQYFVRSMAGHSLFVEKGTRPHKVSPKHLFKWAQRVLGDKNAAYPIAKSIAKKGTKEHPFMFPNYVEVRDFWLPHFMEKELNKQSSLS